jgi:sugar lactone lactonase YvrE
MRHKAIWVGLVGIAAACNPPPPRGGGSGGGSTTTAESVCGPIPLAAGCYAGRCRVSAPLGTIPAGHHVILSELTVPAALTSEVTFDALCKIETSGPNILHDQLELAVKVGNQASDSAIFRYDPPNPSALVASSANDNRVEGLVLAGTFGVTKRPARWQVDEIAGVDVTDPADAASRLRDIASRGITAAYWDGTRLFVGNGNRVLVYVGLPSDPTAPPSYILGQPDIAANLTKATSSVIGGGVQGIWSSGTKLVVSAGNRVLVWNTMPTASFTPADVVLGQNDFSTDVANSGGVSGSSLYWPSQIDSDGTRLAVADSLNNRVLVWSAFPTAVGQPATSVIGQGDLFSNTYMAGATSIYQAWGVALAPGGGAFVTGHFTWSAAHVPSALATNPAPDFQVAVGASRVTPDATWLPSGVARVGAGLAIRDTGAQRVEMLRSLPTHVTSFDYFLGQPDGDRASEFRPSGSTMYTFPSYSVSANAGVVLVPDVNRLLVFQSPSYSYEPASLVIGQAGFHTNEKGADYRSITGRTLGAPNDVAVSGNTVAVADTGNNRVLIYDKSALASPAPVAKVVLGQPNATSYVANFDLKSPTAARMSGPAGVALDGTHLIVADTENHRVLIWNSVPASNGAPADLVLGQSDFTSRRPNRGRGDADLDGRCDTGADGLFHPTGVASDGTHLFVADRVNNRVLVWSTFPTAVGQAADAVLGQPSFTANAPNRGAGWASPRADGLSLPTGVTLSGTSLFVADTENNRVVRYDDATTSPTVGAVIGQPDGTTLSNPNSQSPLTGTANPGIPAQQPATATSVVRPRSVAIASGRLYVSETASNRVHMFDAATLAPAGALGQPNDTSSAANLGGIGAASLSGPNGLATDGTTLFVADTDNHRVLGYAASPPPSTSANASLVIGQSSMLANDFNQASTAAHGATSRPRGLFLRDGDLYVADTEHHRIEVLDSPPVPGNAPKRVLGQPDTSLALPNAGGAPSSRSLRSPRGVFVDATRIVVADTGNNRVLVFNKVSPDAVLVLGQSGFGGALANRGGAPGAATLAAPESAWVEGSRLIVADTGNHRVLVWNTFPTSNGQAADVVLGQADATSGLSNRGSSAAAANTLSFPSSVRVEGGALFVADTGNNRVLRFASIPATNGAAATSVLGQADMTSRSAAQSGTDTDRLAGPAALASDGAYLYVADRDVARVVSFPLPAAGTTAIASVLGAPTGLQLSAPAGLVAEARPQFTSRLYVSDTNADRIIVVGSLSRLAP